MSIYKQYLGTNHVICTLYEMVKDYLGSKSIKCVIDEYESIFTGDMVTLLSSVEIEHPVGELILQAINSHRERHGEGVRTCLFMMTRIAKAVHQLHELGIEREESLPVVNEVINYLSSHIKQICIPFHLSSFNNSLSDIEISSNNNLAKEDLQLNLHSHPDKPESCDVFSKSVKSSSSLSAEAEVRGIASSSSFSSAISSLSTATQLSVSSTKTAETIVSETSSPLFSSSISTPLTRTAETLASSSAFSSFSSLSMVTPPAVATPTTTIAAEESLQSVSSLSMKTTTTSIPSIEASDHYGFDGLEITFENHASTSNSATPSQSEILASHTNIYGNNGNGNPLNGSTPQIIMESDPVILKMVQPSFAKDQDVAGDDESLDWYFGDYSQTLGLQNQNHYEQCESIPSNCERLDGRIKDCEPQESIQSDNDGIHIEDQAGSGHFNESHNRMNNSEQFLIKRGDSKRTLQNCLNDILNEGFHCNTQFNHMNGYSETGDCRVNMVIGNDTKFEQSSVSMAKKNIDVPLKNGDIAASFRTNGTDDHDSDFDDCFDDIENRKEVVVVVERKDEWNMNDETKNNTQIQKSPSEMQFRLARNAQKHFADVEFESHVEIPSLGDKLLDDDFDDCFDNCTPQSIDKDKDIKLLLPSSTLNNFTESHECQKSNSSNRTDNNSRNISVGNTSSNTNQISLGTLNSLLSSLGQNESHNFKEVMLSSRHRYTDEDQLINTRLDISSEHNFSKETLDDLGVQCSINYINKDSQKDAAISNTSTNTFHCDDHKCKLIPLPVKESSLKSNSFVSMEKKSVKMSALPPTVEQSSELSKLDSLLSSLNVRSIVPRKRQILLSSRHNLEAENSPEEHLSHVHSTGGYYPETMMESSVSDKFEKSSISSDDCDRNIDKSSHVHFTNYISLKQSNENHISVNRRDQQSLVEIKQPNSDNSSSFDTTVVHNDTVKSNCHSQVIHCKQTNMVDSASGHNPVIRSCGLFNKSDSCDILSQKEECLHNSSLPLKEKNASVDCVQHLLAKLLRYEKEFVDIMEQLSSVSVDSSNSSRKTLRLDRHLTNCISVESTKTTKSVVNGIVITCTSQILANLKTQFSHSLKAILINGDLTPSHRHKGYKPIIAKKNVIKPISEVGDAPKNVHWAKSVIKHLKWLEISLVLIRGSTTSVMSDLCQAAGITVLENIPFHSLNIISNQFKVDLLCYADSASTSNVCKLCMEPLNVDWMDIMDRKNHCLKISSTGNVKTVVIEEPSMLASQMAVERFWKCFDRVNNAIEDGMVLPGSGVAEKWCYDQIHHMVHTSSSLDLREKQLLRLTILEELADVFKDFASTVRCNTRKERSHLPSYDRDGLLLPDVSIETCDVLSSKISAWKSAVDLVSVVSSLDCLITTGVPLGDLDPFTILL